MKTLFHKYNRKSWILFLLSTAAACILYPFLPNEVPLHFNFTGEVTNAGGKWFIFLGPGCILAMLALWELMRRVDPKKHNYEDFSTVYYRIQFAFCLLLAMLEGIMAAAALNYGFNVSTAVMLGVGILLLVLGNLMPKFRQNYFAGFRTCWALADEDNWYQTQRLAARVWVACGLITMAAAFLPLTARLIVFSAALAAMVALPTAGSYLCYRKKQSGSESPPRD